LLAHPDRHLSRKPLRRYRLNTSLYRLFSRLRKASVAPKLSGAADNIFKTYLIEKGEVDCIWEKADYIVEGEYTTGVRRSSFTLKITG